MALSHTIRRISLLAALFLLLAATASASSPFLCKCTCFTTNTTIVPLYAPKDSRNPCSTCTRQFCLEQGLESCKGATLERPDADTGTGWEGQVWARCFQRDSYKDKSIVTLYILTLLGLLATAALRGRIGGWMEEFRAQGPQGVYRAVASAPWVRASSDALRGTGVPSWVTGTMGGSNGR